MHINLKRNKFSDSTVLNAVKAFRNRKKTGVKVRYIANKYGMTRNYLYYLDKHVVLKN